MYHYRECGLPNVFLRNGYREVKTANGPAVSIQDVEGLHEVISRMIVNEAPFLTGPELRFIRKYLGLTQGEMGTYLGLDEQSIRRWEKLGRLPKQGDKGVRLLFRDLRPAHNRPLPELMEHIEHAKLPDEIRYEYSSRLAEPWRMAA